MCRGVARARPATSARWPDRYRAPSHGDGSSRPEPDRAGPHPRVHGLRQRHRADNDRIRTGAQPAQSAPTTSDSRVTWLFTERVRYAGLFNQFRPGLSGDDRALVVRTTLHAEFTFRFVTLGGEVQDARAYLTDAQSNFSTSLVNPIDLLQAYVRLGSVSTNVRAPDVQIGRFSMGELGSGRLIAHEAYRDVTRTFTGAKVRCRPHVNGQVTGFGVFPVATLPDGRQDLLHNRIARDAELFNQRF
jgi:hypothetical protein